MQVPVHLEFDEELKLYSAYVPDIPGCGEGATEEEAITDLMESLRAYIDVRGVEKARSLIRPVKEIRQVDLGDLSRA